MKTPFVKIAAIIGAPDIETQDGGSFFSTDQLQTIENALPSAGVTEQIAELTTQIDTQTTEISDLNATIIALKAENEQLKQGAGAPATKVVVPAAESTETKTENKTENTYEALMAKWDAAM